MGRDVSLPPPGRPAYWLHQPTAAVFPIRYAARLALLRRQQILLLLDERLLLQQQILLSGLLLLLFRQCLLFTLTLTRFFAHQLLLLLSLHLPALLKQRL